MNRYTTFPSPIGRLVASAQDDELTRLGVAEESSVNAGEHVAHSDDQLFSELHDQLELYWERKLRDFDIPVAPSGTAFQMRVWSTLRTIRYGQTISYAELAGRIGQPAAVRAVGGANGANPIAIIIPCHRVIGSDGALSGYAGGVERKRTLLALEDALTAKMQAQDAQSLRIG